MKPPPPMLPAVGCTTASASAVATAASIALPPSLSTSAPICDAIVFAEITMPFFARTGTEPASTTTRATMETTTASSALRIMSGSPSHLGRPPAQADQEKTPVVEKLRRLSFKRVADELEHPADQEERQRDGPEPGDEKRRHDQHERDHDQRDAQRVAEAIHRMLMAGRVLRDPLIPGFSAQHKCSLRERRFERRALRREQLRAVLGDEHVVFDSHPEFAADVDTRLVAERHAGQHL